MSQQKGPYSYKATVRAAVIVCFIAALLIFAWLIISNAPSMLSGGPTGVCALLIVVALVGGRLLSMWFKAQDKLK